MDSKVTFREIIAACLVITAFTVTGIMIMNENYRYALISLAAAAFFVLMLFLALLAGEEDKILDLSNPSLRNPRKSALSKKRVTYIDRITPDLTGLVSQSQSEKTEKSRKTEKLENSKKTEKTEKPEKSRKIEKTEKLENSRQTENFEEWGDSGQTEKFERQKNSEKRTKSKSNQKRSATSLRTSGRSRDSYKLEDMSGDFYESVGNMRVYKRGEKIELHNDEEDDTQ